MNEQKNSGFWDRAIRNLRGVWSRIGSDEDEFTEIVLSPELDDGDRDRLLKHMQACLDDRGGEVSARTRAAALGHAYLGLNEEGRKRFLQVMATEFDTDHEAVDAAVKELQSATDPVARQNAEQSLKKSLEAARVRLLTQFNALPEGVKFLVDLRADLTQWVKDDPVLQSVETDLKALLSSWFDVGFLELKQITWDAPAALLEKLFAYEAVHEIKSWDDLKNRLASDRRCFAFFHPRMPEEPLIFVWVALTEGISTNIQELLDEDAPIVDVTDADSAIFYSISSAQQGLSGINFGNFLIKRVVDSLSGELRGLKRYSTLSPIPGFCRWLKSALDDERTLEFLSDEQRSALTGLAMKDTAAEAIRHLLFEAGWYGNAEKSEALQEPLLKLAARYICVEKWGGGTALDSVAHFHLNNGARVEQINWEADTSSKGLQQSAGLMVNYRYLLEDIDGNHESYRSGQEVSTSNKVKSLLKV